MNFETLAKTYVSSRRIIGLLGTPSSIDGLRSSLRRIAENPRLTEDLLDNLVTLESHTRVMGFDEAVHLVDKR